MSVYCLMIVLVLVLLLGLVLGVKRKSNQHIVLFCLCVRGDCRIYPCRSPNLELQHTKGRGDQIISIKQIYVLVVCLFFW